MTRNSTFFLSGRTSITALSLLAAFSMISGETLLDHLNKCDAKCWYYEDENVAVYATQGDRSYMEDRILFEKNIASSGLSVYAVFDGNGGEKAVKYVTENFMNVLKQIIQEVSNVNLDESEKIYFSIDCRTILQEALTTIEKQLLEEMTRLEDGSGTTATVALIDEYNKLVYIANVGDSRAIMGDENGNTCRLSIDHTPNNPKEQERIKNTGGSVNYYYGSYRLDGLTASRALGDLSIKQKKYVIADPDTFVFDLSRYQPKLLVLTSRGIVNVIPDEAIVALAESRLEVKGKYFGAQEIGNLAYKRGSVNNTTVLIVKM